MNHTQQNPESGPENRQTDDTVRDKYIGIHQEDFIWLHDHKLRKYLNLKLDSNYLSNLTEQNVIMICTY